MSDPANHIDTMEALDAIYGEANPRSLAKELDHISKEYQAFIERSPFVVLATAGPEGLDCSPRGDPPGFCVVEDSKTVLMPDRRGNNRVDSLRNIVRDPRISLLFFVPGVGETIRINGTAQIRTDPDLLSRFEIKNTLPRSVVVVTADRVYFQCQKALHRSRLWSEESHVPRKELPSAGDILKSVDQAFDSESYDRTYPEHMKKTIY